MQNQQAPSSTSLQQQTGNLQQNSPNLQQSGTPTSTANSSNILSEAAPNGQLRVTTAQSSNATIQAPQQAVSHSNGWLLLLLIIPVVLALAIFWPRTKQQVETAEPEPVPELQPTTPQPKKAKTKKKSSKKKRSGKH